MAKKLLTLSDADKREARKAGKIPAAPKKPKKSASLDSKENYITRYNDWVKKVKDMASRAKRELALDKTIYGR